MYIICVVNLHRGHRLKHFFSDWARVTRISTYGKEYCSTNWESRIKALLVKWFEDISTEKTSIRNDALRK